MVKFRHIFQTSCFLDLRGNYGYFLSFRFCVKSGFENCQTAVFGISKSSEKSEIKIGKNYDNFVFVHPMQNPSTLFITKLFEVTTSLALQIKITTF